MNSEIALDQVTSHTKDKKSIKSYFIFRASIIFYVFIFFLILSGWTNRENSYLSPETGIGYYLGIIGGCMMLLLLLYPLRKKARFMHHLGQVKYWFKMHMLFGVLGPVAILYHANFSLGSVNGSIAMLSMILVATSGLIGRYFYSRLHYGLYGRKASLQELRDSLLISKGHIGSDIKLSKTSALLIKQAEQKTLRNRNFIKSILIWPYIKFSIFLIKRKLRNSFYADFSKNISRDNKDKEIIMQLTNKASNGIDAYLAQLYKIFSFKIFQSLFSLWHILHLPLFIMLVIAGILHVVVVHSY